MPTPGIPATPPRPGTAGTHPAPTPAPAADAADAAGAADADADVAGVGSNAVPAGAAAFLAVASACWPDGVSWLAGFAPSFAARLRPSNPPDSSSDWPCKFERLARARVHRPKVPSDAKVELSAGASLLPMTPVPGHASPSSSQARAGDTPPAGPTAEEEADTEGSCWILLVAGSCSPSSLSGHGAVSTPMHLLKTSVASGSATSSTKRHGKTWSLEGSTHVSQGLPGSRPLTLSKLGSKGK
mmetsp:Transcript_91410/g.200310  ORF Transcript_91410/g.200310 Transcript_91410/m.200310 type:complete len:242 (+) Transcript_91410:1591-2316(+)